MNRKFILIVCMIILSQTLFAKKVRLDHIELADDTQDIEIIPQLVDSLSNDTIIADFRPEEEYQPQIFKPQISTLHIPVTINISLLEKKLNEQFSGLIYEDANINDDSLMVRAWKAKDFELKYETNTLYYTIPIKLWIKKRFGLGFTSTDQEIEGSIKLDLKTSIHFSKDWNILTKTELLNYAWISKPVLKFGPINIPITPIVDKILNSNKQLINNSIDQTVKENVPLSQFIRNIWESVQDPINVSAGSIDTWIKITPTNLYTTPITGENGQIKTTIGVQCLSEIFLDRIPMEKQKELQIPSTFKMYKSTDEKVALNILADIPYSTIDTLAGKLMQGETLGEGKRTITIDSMEFFGQNDKLMIGVYVHGFINGAVFLSGVPYFEQENSLIRIKDVDYKLQTKNLLVKIVNLFYKNGLKKIIEERVVVSLKDQLEWIKEMSRTELFNRELTPNVFINGLLNELTVDNIYLTPNGLKVSVKLGGKVSVKVE